MNQGAATSQRALEITLVRNEMDAQAEALRFLGASYGSAYNKDISAYTGPAEQWRIIKEKVLVERASPFNSGTSCEIPSSPSIFIINARRALLADQKPGLIDSTNAFSQVVYDSSDNVISAKGIWIEAVTPDLPSTSEYTEQKNADYIDFYIRACWDSPGQSVPVTLGTIVRLYEPRG
jgi:hypothetical protein